MAKFKSYSTEQGELFPMYLSDWIPEDHLVRLVSDIVDQLDLTVMTNRYSHRGEEAYHPAMLLKLWFYGYATGVFTSRTLRQAMDENIPFRWLCGGHRPDFRTLSDFRKDHLESLPGLFKQVVHIAIQLGYVSLGHVSIDGSKLKAHASKHKSMSRDRMNQEIERLEKEIREALEQAGQIDDQENEEPLSLLPESVTNRQSRLEKIREALRQLEARKPVEESKTPDKDQFNFTDPDSQIMDTKTQGVIQGYNPQIAVDADQGFIVGLQMNPSSSDQHQFQPVLGSIRNITGKVPEKVSADAGYFSADNIQAATKAETDAYIAATRENKQHGNPYDKTNFTYIPETDTYVCPAGQTLIHKYTYYEKDPQKATQWVYMSDACLTCPFQKDCVKSGSGKRRVKRNEGDPIREAMRTKVQSDAGKDIYRLRKAIVEPAWGQMKECQGFRQFHLRGEDKVEGEFVLLALSYNLRKLHSAKYPKPSTVYKRERSAQKRKKAA
ncbi:Transposase DDE domain protein [Paenibacillus konkukensis]|uniref:Transposase DDE domain protein n=1 Tax=Paenibacillus konkukensis TaxID=2020716 RepID=A0ABY4RKD2_9BACL|nr:IS1182 family transposase [Paenibacillus konkukensis]UQZ81403.1 Transposase DDE domain protein [Paenibacillus konkukensis]UQZ82966.1 Transposase DDE domain protein [Paenibacillus konkukensis]UQZ83527.1 Transposase DDE domain protein [Paenibacillus konkukensis]UQZ83769.1 Transposase DDE domain protein [Paenibacillus konkukensis]UQZ84039.1 Transposase DDE domain protein [Paenibacillus konkukensis]